MATWKRFTGAVDSSAQSFLKNKRFSREKRTFTWDWHAWNLALVSTPSFLLAYYLHGVEKRMHEEAAIRDEIQERTGVSSRGFLIPKREVKEEVLGMLSAGNQRGAEAATSGGDSEGEGQGGKDNLGRDVSADFKSIQRRLDAIESMLGVPGDSSSAERLGVEAGEGSGTNTTPPDSSGSRERGELVTAEKSASTTETSGAEAEQGQSMLDRAAGRAAAAGTWAATTGERQGRRLLQMGRDWLVKDNRQEDSTHSGNSGLIEGEQNTSGTAVAEVRRQEEKPSAKTLDGFRPSNSADISDGKIANDSGGSTDGAWRNGRLDGNDKQR